MYYTPQLSMSHNRCHRHMIVNRQCPKASGILRDFVTWLDLLLRSLQASRIKLSGVRSHGSESPELLKALSKKSSFRSMFLGLHIPSRDTSVLRRMYISSPRASQKIKSKSDILTQAGVLRYFSPESLQGSSSSLCTRNFEEDKAVRPGIMCIRLLCEPHKERRRGRGSVIYI